MNIEYFFCNNYETKILCFNLSLDSKKLNLEEVGLKICLIRSKQECGDRRKPE